MFDQNKTVLSEFLMTLLDSRQNYKSEKYDEAANYNNRWPALFRNRTAPVECQSQIISRFPEWTQRFFQFNR